MTVHHFAVTEENCPGSTLIGITVDIQTTANYPGWQVALDGLFKWCLMIADDVVHQRVDHNELIDEGIHIRVTSKSGEILADTILERAKRTT